MNWKTIRVLEGGRVRNWYVFMKGVGIHESRSRRLYQPRRVRILVQYAEDNDKEVRQCKD